MSQLVADNLFLALDVKHPDFGSMKDPGWDIDRLLPNRDFFRRLHTHVQYNP